MGNKPSQRNMMAGDCTSGPSMAKALGYYDNWGLDVQIAAGTETQKHLELEKLSLEHIILHIC